MLSANSDAAIADSVILSMGTSGGCYDRRPRSGVPCVGTCVRAECAQGHPQRTQLWWLIARRWHQACQLSPRASYGTLSPLATSRQGIIYRAEQSYGDAAELSSSCFGDGRPPRTSRAPLRLKTGAFGSIDERPLCP